jgi:hypothetical protein
LPAALDVQAQFKRDNETMNLMRLGLAFTIFIGIGAGFGYCDEEKPHAVFVVGTPHYSPARSMPLLASHLERIGFRTTVVKSKANPEHDPSGIPGLEVLETADVAIFFVRFLTLPDDQLKLIERYLESGKPLVGFRTSSHAFAYPKDHEHFGWNDGFGLNGLGVKYETHLTGKTTVSLNDAGKKHWPMVIKSLVSNSPVKLYDLKLKQGVRSPNYISR